MKNNIEILAPAGGMDALIAAVRTGANAVYLGGTNLNARHGAKNFDKAALKEAVSYCHARGVQVHLTLNTIVFDDELQQAEQAIKEAAEAGVDAFIIQDLGVAELAKACAPDIQRHGSTQMAVHNRWGVEFLAELGFSRAVLARELTAEEIAVICKDSPIEIETFVHGALCSSVSGQCYISALIGGRSGNRGRCAQTCRLPFQSEAASHALSLKDLSVIDQIPYLHSLGVTSFKIEGRLKRPEYVAATVTACNDVLAGREVDYDTLQAIFSRSGFTDGYVSDQMGEEMFGTRTKEDVVSAGSTLKELASLYRNENPLVEVDFLLEIKADAPSQLTATVGEFNVVAQGPEPQTAISAPTTYEKALSSLGKTGNTPFSLGRLTCEIEDGLMLPASQLNGLRRDALEQLLLVLEQPRPKAFRPYQWPSKELAIAKKPQWRIRVETVEQLSTKFSQDVENLIIPIHQALKMSPELMAEYKEKVLLELPRITFTIANQKELEDQLKIAQQKGFTKVIAGGYGAVYLAQKLGFEVHGDFGLNVVNNLSITRWKMLKVASSTLSIEYGLSPKEPKSDLPKGLLVYGKLPAMIFRNHPAGLGEQDGKLTDRLGNKFSVRKTGEVTTLYNCVPLYLGDRLHDLKGMDFYTLYFTDETKEECEKIWSQYQNQEEIPKPYTRGIYLRRVE